MATKELVGFLLNPLTSGLNQRGKWKYVKSRQRFERKITGGLQSIQFDYKSWVEVISVWIDVAVRLDAVEEEMNFFYDFMADNDKKHTTTIGIHWGNLEGDYLGWKTVDVWDETSGEICAGEILTFLDDMGFAFMDEFSNAEHIFNLVKTESDLAKACSGNHERGQYAILLAYLLGCNEESPGIIQDKKDAFSKYDTNVWTEKLDGFVEKFKARHPSVYCKRKPN